MTIGLDLDNTIICYDRLFWTLGRERGVVPETLHPDKTEIRDHLRAAGIEDVWTEMQGEAYGPRIVEAEPFPGVVTFVQRAVAAGADVHVVSHKTRFPYAGARHDLHEAALAFLKFHGLLAEGMLDHGRVHLEPTKEAKLARVGALRCDVFVDDLPEFLGAADFPSGVRRVLFDPSGGCPSGPWLCVAGWEKMADAIGLEESGL